MAACGALWLPPTIEEDEDVVVDESDSDQEEATFKATERNSTARKQVSIFSDDFSFSAENAASGGVVERGWDVDEAVMESAGRKRDLMMTSLDSKILRAIEQRRLKVRRFTLSCIIQYRYVWGEISVIITLYDCKFRAEIISIVSVILGMSFRYFGYTFHDILVCKFYSGIQLFILVYNFLVWCTTFYFGITIHMFTSHT